jgi:thioredoxin reductase (NADPH)
VEKIIIAGSGPAGLTAAIYIARAGFTPLLIDGFQVGGQLTQTDKVENFPGFPDGIGALDLMDRMRQQAENLGVRFVSGELSSIEIAPDGNIICSLGDGTKVTTVALIGATGATARKLGMESEAKYTGLGVSGCAVCDGPFYRGKKVAVIGGGDTALGDAVYLARICESVDLIHRRDEFRGAQIARDRVMENEKIKIHWDSVPDEILGTDAEGVTGIRIKNKISGELTELPASGVFVAIGHNPVTGWASGLLELDEEGYFKTNNTLTNVPGIFVAGDVQDRLYKQAVTAAASGCIAALAAEDYLRSK